MLDHLKNRNLYLMLAADAALFVASLVLAYLIRFEFSPEPYYLAQLGGFLPFFVAVKLAVYALFGQYRGMWRYTSLFELTRLIQAAGVSSLALVAGVLYVMGFAGYSRSVFLLDLILTVVLTAGLRISIRRFFERGLSFGGWGAVSLFTRRRRGLKKVLIVGSGFAAEQIVRELFKNRELGLEPVGLVDDDPRALGRSVHGVSVLGRIAELDALVRREGVSEVFIALPKADGETMRAIVAQCEGASVSFKTVPSMGELIDGRVSIQALREVNLEDLLGRAPVDLETSRIAGYLTGKTVLVTGCGGSIGSELTRQIVKFSPARLILLDAGEYNLYEIQMELHHEHGFTDYIAVLGSLQNRALVERVFAAHAPDVVFHAAAYKHVPLIETNPWEAAFNNVMASKVLLETAVAHETERFVLVSTDKAVRPTNVMGASKRVTELLLYSLVGRGTKLMAVRFGNVIGSSGSVIPLFMDQIRRGGPVTVTDPEVTRYFMTIAEAAQLILQAGSMGGEGEVFLLKMGRPVKIADMARDLIRLSGKEPDTEIEIRYTGLREGEKLYEELITAGENVVATSHDKIMLLAADEATHGPGGRRALAERLEARVNELMQAAEAFDHCRVKAVLASMVEEYEPADTGCVFAPGARSETR